MCSSKWRWFWPGLFILSSVWMGCSQTDDNQRDNTPLSVTVDGAAPELDPGNVGANLTLNAGTGPDAIGTHSTLPGCSDPGATECPVSLVLDLDGVAAADGIQIAYPTRYFEVTLGTDIAIEIAPSARNKFAERAIFQVYYTESVTAALDELEDPITGAWDTGTLRGTIGVVKDQTQDPPVNTAIGAFELDDGRAIVLKAITTGKYGWDLYAQLYEDLLNSLIVNEGSRNVIG